MSLVIPEQLKTIDPMLLAKVKQEFADTEFICSECGGMLLPFNMITGVCFNCGVEETLSDADYTIVGEE